MKITGLILALVGLIGGAICMMGVIQPDTPNRDVPPPASGEIQRPNLVIPLTMCGAAVVVGGLMYVYGGKGYFVSYNPNVRN